MKNALMVLVLLAAAAPAQAACDVTAITPPLRYLTGTNATIGPTSNTNDYWPSFSPDGRKVLFSRATDGGKWILNTIPVAGGAPSAITLSSSDPSKPVPGAMGATRASWSVQNRIAFTGIQGGLTTLWIANSDGSGAYRSAAFALSDQTLYPSWFPNGAAVEVMNGEANVLQHVVLPDGPVTVTTDRARLLTGMSSVSPDGGTIAFAGQENNGQEYDQQNNQIWLITPHHLAYRLEDVPKEGLPAIQGRAPSWAPNGNRIAFESNRCGSDYAAYVIHLDKTHLVRLTDPALGANHPMWSPDGKSMVFSVLQTNGKNAIAIIDVSAIP